MYDLNKIELLYACFVYQIVSIIMRYLIDHVALHTVYLSLSKEDVVVGMLKKFEMATEDETAQEKWKSARKIKRQVSYGILFFR